MFKKVFSDSGTFEAWYACQRWLDANGYSYGSTSCRAPSVGVLKGSFAIAKMHNLTRQEIDELDGLVTGDFREGPVTLTLKNEPEQPCIDPAIPVSPHAATHKGIIASTGGRESVNLRQTATTWCTDQGEYYYRTDGRHCGHPHSRLLLDTIEQTKGRDNAKGQ